MKVRIVIIGGLSAGPSAATKARRTNPDCEILLFEKTSNISTATCGIPYALASNTDSSDKLSVVDAHLLKNRFDIDVHLNETIIDIDVEAHVILTDKGKKYNYSKLIFATGASAFKPPVKGLDLYTNWSHCKTLSDLKKVFKEGVLQKAEKITVLGSGLIGIEVAENLAKAGKQVTIIELQSHILPIWNRKFSKMAETVLSENNIQLKTGVKIVEVNPENGILHLSDGQVIASDYLFVAVGLKPNTELLLSEGVEHLKNGALVVNQKMETSLQDIYAAGDCVSIKNLITDEYGYFPMGTHSNKGGRVAGANAAGGNEIFKGAYGTTIVKIFDYTLARTGLNGSMLKSKRIDHESIFFVSTATPSFYETPSDLFVEVYFDKENMQILGAEVFGSKGVDKRIDVLSTAIYAGLTTKDLQNLDLAYAPPYSPAKDAIIIAGYIAEREKDAHITDINPLDLFSRVTNFELNNALLIDIREEDEVKNLGKIPEAINQPLETLLLKTDLIDKQREIIVYCQRGARGYIASLALKAKGFSNIKNVAGGFAAWQMMDCPIEGVPEKKINGKNYPSLNGKMANKRANGKLEENDSYTAI